VTSVAAAIMSGVSLVVLLPLVVAALGLALALAGVVLTVATRGAAADAGSRAAFVGLRWVVPIAVLWLFVAFVLEAI
jgi:hypothetical protein